MTQKRDRLTSQRNTLSLFWGFGFLFYQLIMNHRLPENIAAARLCVLVCSKFLLCHVGVEGFWNWQWLQCGRWDLKAKQVCVSCVMGKKVCVCAGMTPEEQETLHKQEETWRTKVLRCQDGDGDNWSPSFRQTVAFQPIFTLRTVLNKETAEVGCNILPVMQQTDLDLRWTQIGQTVFRLLLKA